jgi:hypothetical protein
MKNPLKSVADLTAELTNRIAKHSRLLPNQPFIPQKPWWVKIHTQNPTYTYYFGPFDSRVDAVMNQFGYIQDLEQENSQNITVEIDQFSPEQLTICED